MLFEIQAEVTETPGATMSTQEPKLLKVAKRSLISLAAIVKAPGVLAGDASQALIAEFPAATTTVIPRDTKFSTAASRVELAPPPRLRLTTAGEPAALFRATKSRPETTEDKKPEPLQSSTRTGTMLAALATP